MSARRGMAIAAILSLIVGTTLLVLSAFGYINSEIVVIIGVMLYVGGSVILCLRIGFWAGVTVVFFLSLALIVIGHVGSLA